jgi:NAD(P)H dehydrogenase (quinone)
MTTTPTVLVIDGHPNPSSPTAGLADAYADAAAQSGATVERLTLRDLDFDPVLHLGLRGSQPLEPDLARAQELLAAADHVTVLAPVWWGSTPALLKGFFDRVLEAKWAYHYGRLGLPHGHLAGRSARFVMLADSPGFYLALVQRNPTRRQVVRSTLTFCGFSPVSVTRFSPVRTASDGKRAAWIAQVGDLAAKDAGRCGRQRKTRTDPFQIRDTLTTDAN